MTTNVEISSTIPRVGMLATIRNRRAIVSSVEPFDGPDGRLHLVTLEYIDADGVPDDMVLWERELGATLLEPNALPMVSSDPPMTSAEFDALQRATRWTALTPFIADQFPEKLKTPISAPLFGAVQIEDFQLVPLLKALKMPRISLLLADDVGLGKTIEAGLILRELLLRRRIRRVLIMCPASLRNQWQQEMHDKFALNFEIIDRAETHAIQKRLGLDANPWRTYPRIITSYYYLRQPDVLEQFRAACRQPEGTVQLPWDLLIVDEAHNLMPSNFGEDSDLAKMLRFISPWFEHKLFLTATPHNGHTRCFSGLLEQLDPVRFTQTSDFSEAENERIEEVVIRRLKREINAIDEEAGRPARFSERIPEPLPLFFGPKEKNVAEAFQSFRSKVKSVIASSTKSEQLAGSFAVEVLNKRLLSSPYTFAESWYRFKEGLEHEEQADTSEVNAARRAVTEELDDDRESESRIQFAAKITGAWLKPLAPHLQDEIYGLDSALRYLGLDLDQNHIHNPDEDARFDRLLKLIQDRLRDGKEWVKDERLIVFTEYKTTLDYLERRLQKEFSDVGVLQVLFGGMHYHERELIKTAFNDPEDPMRILVSTDAASEGLNLQETARLVLHYDIPFNPARLDQRNGRLDRHGQARDVIVFHFTSEDDADLKFLSHVVTKVNIIREDLGSMGEVFDAAFERRFTDLLDTDRVVIDLDQAIEKHRGRAKIPRFSQATDENIEQQALVWLAREIDLSPDTLKDTLEQALGFDIGLPRFENPDEKGRFRLRMPAPPRWEDLIDSSLRLTALSGRRGALPSVVFNSDFFIENRNGRLIFRSSKDTVMLHLGHPMFQRALALFARARFPGSGDWQPPSRWTIKFGDVPEGMDALLLLTVEELAINELRESFHHWVHTIRIPIINYELGDRLPHIPAAEDQCKSLRPDNQDTELAQELWEEVEIDVRDNLNRMAGILTAQLQQELKKTGVEAVKEENDRFENRIKEVKRAMQETTLKKLEKESDKIEAERRELQMTQVLFEDMVAEREDRIKEIERRKVDIEEELHRRRTHYNELLNQLKDEQKRVIKELLPKRYKLRGNAQVFPVTVEIRMPEVLQ